MVINPEPHVRYIVENRNGDTYFIVSVNDQLVPLLDPWDINTFLLSYRIINLDFDATNQRLTITDDRANKIDNIGIMNIIGRNNYRIYLAYKEIKTFLKELTWKIFDYQFNIRYDGEGLVIVIRSRRKLDEQYAMRVVPIEGSSYRVTFLYTNLIKNIHDNVFKKFDSELPGIYKLIKALFNSIGEQV